MESKPIPARYFLGANAKHGFSSLYDNFVDLEGGDFLWVIKGGPGCGKSSFMKRIGQAAEEHGEAVEYIHCSGDPDSLDGVYLPKKRTAYVDGTAPHFMIELNRPQNLDEAIIKVEIRPQDFSDRMNELQKLRDNIAHQVFTITGLHFKIELAEPNSLQRFTGKASRVIDNRKLKD